MSIGVVLPADNGALFETQYSYIRDSTMASSMVLNWYAFLVSPAAPVVFTTTVASSNRLCHPSGHCSTLLGWSVWVDTDYTG